MFFLSCKKFEKYKKGKMNKIRFNLRKLCGNKTVVYLDLEYINRNLGFHCRPNLAKDWTEIVQFGAVKFNHQSHKELGHFNRLVKPTIYSDNLNDTQWKFFENLTGLKQNEIMNTGHDLANTFQEFQDFTDGHQVIVMQDDQYILEQNLKTIDESFDIEDFWQLKPILLKNTENEPGLHERYKNLCSGELYKEIFRDDNHEIPADNDGVELLILGPEGLKNFDMNAHNALFDARSMAMFVDFCLCYKFN